MLELLLQKEGGLVSRPLRSGNHEVTSGERRAHHQDSRAWLFYVCPRVLDLADGPSFRGQLIPDRLKHQKILYKCLFSGEYPGCSRALGGHRSDQQRGERAGYPFGADPGGVSTPSPAGQDPVVRGSLQVRRSDHVYRVDFERQRSVHIEISRQRWLGRSQEKVNNRLSERKSPMQFLQVCRKRPV